MSIRSLTQAEAEERAALLAVERYDIAVDLTDLPTGPSVRCVSTVTFTCRQPGAQSFIDCAAEVSSATLNGAPLGPAVDGRLALPDLAEHNTVRVESVQADTTEGAGVHKAVDPADKEVYVWMSFEPDEARYVWACFDQPDLKAPHAFTVTAPRAWTVTSNCGDAQVEDADEARRWTFPATPPLSTYNTVINAGPLYQIRRELGGYDLGLYARRTLAPILDRDADEIFTVTAQGLGFFGEVFGMPFPQRRYDQVFMPEYGGAMENYGCVTWSDASLCRWEPTPAEREDFARILLHEMAHMWFGNIVTMRWWDDLWLNEAFAEFACNWAAVRATAYTDSWARHLASGKLQAYLADQGPRSHPIHQPIRDVAEAASVFDAITYPKGASVLHQLMVYVGEANFQAGMTAYFAKHAWGNTTLQDLVNALAAASGRNLDAWRDSWLATAGTDRLTLERDGDSWVLAARGPGDAPPRPHVVAVGAYRANGSGMQRAARVEVEVRDRRTPVDLPIDADLYLVNDDDLTFATTRPEPGTTPVLLRQAPALPTTIARGVAVATVWDLLVTGEISAADAVHSLTGVLATESSDSVVEPYLHLVVNVTEFWSPERQRAELTEVVAATSRTLAEDPARRQVALRTVAWTARDLDEVAALLAQNENDVDLQWRLLTRKSQLGGETEADVQRLLERDPDPDAQVRALGVRAAAPDAEQKEAAWQALAVEHTVPMGTMGKVATAFWRPGQDELLAPYAQRYLDLLPRMHHGGMIPGMLFTAVLFPLFGIDATFFERAEAIAPETVPVVRKMLAEKADLVKRMLRSRG